MFSVVLHQQCTNSREQVAILQKVAKSFIHDWTATCDAK